MISPSTANLMTDALCHSLFVNVIVSLFMIPG